MKKFVFGVFSIFILLGTFALPVFAENVSAPSLIFNFNFGDKLKAKDYPTITTFKSEDAKIDLERKTFTASAENISGSDLVQFKGVFNPDSDEVRGSFTGYQNYTSKDGKIYTRTSFGGTFSGGSGTSTVNIPKVGLSPMKWLGETKINFQTVFCSSSKKMTQICPLENKDYHGTLEADGTVEVVASTIESTTTSIVISPSTPVSVKTSVPIPPGINYLAFCILGILFLYTIYFLFSGGVCET